MKVVTIKRPIKLAPGKRRLTTEFFDLAHYLNHEHKWHFLLEASLFAVLAVISMWPILIVADALNQLLQQV